MEKQCSQGTPDLANSPTTLTKAKLRTLQDTQSQGVDIIMKNCNEKCDACGSRSRSDEGGGG